MEFQRQLVMYAVLLVLGFTAYVLISSWGSFSVRPGYDEVNGLTEGTSYTVNQTVSIKNLQIGDAVCYKLGDHDDDRVNFGWIAALPGDQLSITNGHHSGNPSSSGQNSTEKNASGKNTENKNSSENSGGKIIVNGKPITRGGNVTMSDSAAITIPLNHIFIVTDLHHRDSIALGPLPAAALIGRINKFP
jgi:Signal peptidase, peptidase S26